MIDENFKEFIALLNKHEVRYLVVGGYAVGHYGRPRYTGDLDVWIAADSANAEKVLAALKDFGFGSLGLKVSDFTTKDEVVQLGYEPVRIDIINGIDGVEFEDCYPNKTVVDVEGVPFDFIGREDLIKNKTQSGRLRDLDDVANICRRKNDE